MIGGEAGPAVPGRDLRPLLLVPIGVAAGIAAIFLPHMVGGGSLALAADYRRYYAATRFLLAGRNPYEQGSLLAAEQHLRSLSAVVNRGAGGFVLLPFALWFLLPVALLPYWLSYFAFALLSVAGIAMAVALMARGLGWHHWWAPGVAAAVWWPVLWGRLLGQLDFLILLGVMGACWLSARHRPFTAGVFLVVVWIQPELAWIAVPGLGLALWDDRRAVARMAAGFAGASLLMFLITALEPGSLLHAWWLNTFSFIHHGVAGQGQLLGLGAMVQMATLPGSALHGVTSVVSLAAACLGLLLAALVAVRLRLLRQPDPFGSLSRLTLPVFLPLAIWLEFAPYGHPENAILLLPLVVLVVGPDGALIAQSRWRMAMIVAFGLLTELATGTILFPDLMPVATLCLLAPAAATWLARSPVRQPSVPTAVQFGS